MLTQQLSGRVLNRLEELERRKGELPDFLRLYRELLQIQYAEEPKISPELVSDEDSRKRACERLRQGLPLLTFDQFRPDRDHLQRVFIRVAEWVARDCSTSDSEAEGLRAIAHSQEALAGAAGDWYAGLGVEEVAREFHVDPGLLALALGAAARPFLNAYAAVLSEKVEQSEWGRRYCPVCGGKPDLSYLHKEDGARRLVCSRCDSDWRYPRVACPRCGNENQADLSFFVDETGQAPYRLYVCESCHGYIKTIDLRHNGDDALFPLERLLTLPMDRQALEKGYHAV